MPVQVEQSGGEGEPVQVEQATGESEVELEEENEEEMELEGENEEDLGAESEEEEDILGGESEEEWGENEEDLGAEGEEEWERKEEKDDLGWESEEQWLRRLRLPEVEKEVVITIWEFKKEEVHPVLLSNSPSWEWVEIARMPSLLCKKWLEPLRRFNEPSFSVDRFMILDRSCIGVGDHVCFTPCLRSGVRPSQVVEVVDYNLIGNTWNWLPSCTTNHFCGDNYCIGSFYTAIAFEPNPQRKVFSI